MEQREAILWATLIMLFIGVIATTFMRMDHPVTGNAVLSKTCGTLERSTVEECRSVCAQIGQCDRYSVSCASRTFSCTCATC